jgi:hypothetical protein
LTAYAAVSLPHAIDDDAVAFYLKHHFLRSPLGARTVVMPIENALALVGD